MVGQDSHDDLFRSSLRFCAWAGIVSIVLFIVGGVILGGMIPPLLAPDDSDHLLAIRVGSVFCMLSFALFGPFGAGIAAQTRRSETNPVMSYVQLIYTAAGTVVAVLVAFCWALMVFRPAEYTPTLVQFLADFAYFLAVFSVPVFGGWCVMIAISVLIAKEGRRPFPRWIGYLNVWAAVLFAPGQMVLFFKHGPFSWNGAVALWLPFIAFFLWILVMCWAMFDAAGEPGKPSRLY